MPTQKTGIDILDQENCEILSKRFPEPIDWSDEPEVEEVYRNLLMIRSSERITMEMDGTFILKEPIKLLSDVGKEKDKEELWWQNGWTKLCAITPYIVERLPDNKGMRVHCIQITSNCLATMLNETNSLLENQEENQNATSGKEEETMADVKYPKLPKDVSLTETEKSFILAILAIASDKTSDKVTVLKYAPLIAEHKLYIGTKAGVSFYASRLRKKEVAFSIKGKIGAIEMLRLEPSELELTTPPKKKTTKKKVTGKKKVSKKKVVKKTAPSESQTTDTPNSNLEAAGEELKNCFEKGNQDISQVDISNQLITLFNQIEDPGKLTDALLKPLTEDRLRGIHNLFRLVEIIQDDHRCPKFDETENGLRASILLPN